MKPRTAPLHFLPSSLLNCCCERRCAAVGYLGGPYSTLSFGPSSFLFTFVYCCAIVTEGVLLSERRCVTRVFFFTGATELCLFSTTQQQHSRSDGDRFTFFSPLCCTTVVKEGVLLSGTWEHRVATDCPGAIRMGCSLRPLFVHQQHSSNRTSHFVAV